MAVEIFFRIDGLNGGSRNYYHKGWSDVVSWNWTLANADEQGADTPASMNTLEVVKRIGMDSPAIMSLFAERRTAAVAEISIVPVVGKREAQQKLLGVVMHDVVVQSITTGGTAEDLVFTEKLTLNFQRVRYEFNQYSDATPDAASGAAETYGFNWDIVKRASW